jgi:phosphomannomutase
MADLQKAVIENGCDLGIGFDGDADRACFCDQNGRLIANDLVTAVLASEFVPQEPGASVVYDLRSSKIVPETITALGGTPLRERVGHAFMKKTLRDAGGPYGGELSGHFYFRSLWYTDSGVYAAGLMLAKLSRGTGTMSEMVDSFRTYLCSGEVNFEVEDKDGTIEQIAAAFPDSDQDRLDGITVDCGDWWCNVRKSNTEPLLRLTFEARDQATYDAVKPQLFAILGTPSDH